MAENDQQNKNTRLAKQFGEYLQGRRSAGSIEDPVFSVLEQVHKDLLLSHENSGKEEVWGNIKQNISSKKRVPRLLRLSAMKKWALAASILIVAAIGFYTLNVSDRQQLVSASQDNIKKVTLSDGSLVTLRPHSRLYKLDEREDKMNYRLEGEAYFEVVKDKSRTFSVSNENNEVTVLGTRFNFSTWGEYIQVYLEEGSIAFKNKNTQEEAILMPGEAARISDSKAAISVQKNVDPGEFLDWKRNKMNFQERKLSSIVDELEKQFNITIMIPEELQTVSLSGELDLSSPEKALDFLSLTLDGSFEPVDSQVYRLTEKSEKK